MIYAYIQQFRKGKEIISEELCGVQDIADRIIYERPLTSGVYKPELVSITNRLREGDLLIISDLSSLGYNAHQTLELWDKIVNEIQADIFCLNSPSVDSRDEGAADIITECLKYASKISPVADVKISAHGFTIGRPPRLEYKGGFPEAYRAVERGEMTTKQAIAKLNISQNCWYKLRKKYLAGVRID